MDFEEYQRLAAQTDRIEGDDELMIPLLGLAGEAGSLLTEFKKRLRDREAHSRFSAIVAEELGDVLWYIATISSRMNLDLAEIAMMNIAKVQDRWGTDDMDQIGLGLDPILLDDSYPPHEQLPRKFSVHFEEVAEAGRHRVRIYMDSVSIGNHLTDNSYDDDGYRYHDVFHLSYAAILGWSPIFRKLISRKRRSNIIVDEVEDGGRAQVLEEAVVAYVYQYARNHKGLENVTTLDYTLLRTLKELTSGLEVSRCSSRDWERAILAGFQVWRGLVRCRSGTIMCDLEKRSITLVEGAGAST